MSAKEPTQKEHPRSIGVIAFGIVTILLPMLSLLGIDIKEPFIMYREPWGSALYLGTMPMAIFEIILGLSILRLKDWARKSLIVLSSIYLCLTAALPFIAKNSFWIYFNKKLDLNLITVEFRHVALFITSHVLWYIIVIVYFSLPYVRWQFWVETQKEKPPEPKSKKPLPF